MATVGKAALVVPVGVIGSMSILSYVSYAQTVSDLPQVLPAGEELPDEKLLEVEGEAGPFAVAGIAFLLAGAIKTLQNAFFDEDPWVIDRDDVGDILSTALLFAITPLIKAMGSELQYGGCHGGVPNHMETFCY